MFEFEDLEEELDGHEIDRLDREWLKDPKNQLLYALDLANQAARKGKRKTHDEHVFEVNYYENIQRLRDDLYNKTYRPLPGTAHVVREPVIREIFAASFRDRIVHHLIVSSIDDYIDKRLWHYSTSCRKKKGTLFGVKGLDHHIRKVSLNYKRRDVYIVKFDIKGYFMHIPRKKLYRIVMRWFDEIYPVENRGMWYGILKHAIYEVVHDNPVEGVKIRDSVNDWAELPVDKCLFCQPPGQGIVIGNLTSQEFSNIFLDILDRFITQRLGYKYYGRYVDDFYIVVTKKQLPQLLRRDKVAIANLLNGMGLTLHPRKLAVYKIGQEVPFLGMKVGVNHIIPGERLKRNARKAVRLRMMNLRDDDVVISYIGMMKHVNHYNAMRKIFDEVGWDYALG